MVYIGTLQRDFFILCEKNKKRRKKRRKHCVVTANNPILYRQRNSVVYCDIVFENVIHVIAPCWIGTLRIIYLNI